LPIVPLPAEYNAAFISKKQTENHITNALLHCRKEADFPYKRSQLVALRTTKISASDPPSIWWPGER